MGQTDISAQFLILKFKTIVAVMGHINIQNHSTMPVMFIILSFLPILVQQ